MLSACLPEARASVSAVDATGKRVTLESPATRVVALAPHAVEMLYAVGAGDALVGAIAGSDYPPAARALPRVGSYRGLSAEAILARRPDLVVTWLSGTPSALVARLRELGVAVYASEPRRLADVPEELRELGRLTGHAAGGETRARAFLARLASQRQRLAEPPRVFYQLGHEPLTTLAGGQIVTQVIRACGGEPLFADQPVLVAQVSREALIAAHPEAILAAAPDDGWQAAWQRWSLLPAVRENHLYTLSPDLISRPGPRLLDGMAEVCAALADTAATQ
ncbi:MULTISPECIES: cobalamin-binding protein [unclassified Modicisalibacter]|uniref:cobalamin-binding protein n=1 Tax=unclassified Modicisalibacter TaxID=2679913 RepID=UPI001CC9303A|nr:cobalamin-binding protein [Modicisalibacter sp. R2A 31.J]MBZ9575005.1 cobalamin-binding protein [Modicisalibacter sp. MOD 31.J]